MKYEAIHRYHSEFSVAKMCEVLTVRQSGYYQWRKGEVRRQERAKRELGLIHTVEEVFYESKQTYGYRRLFEALVQKKVMISRYKVIKIMRQIGFYPILTSTFKPYPKQKSEGRFSENQLAQQFHVNEPNKVWAGDITYIKSSRGWVYLSVVIDLFNREVVGYALSKSPNTELVKRSLGNAMAGREKQTGLIFHSDRGCQYSSSGFGQYLQQLQIQGSMSKAGCPYDNSCVESFFASTKKECIHRRSYDTMEEIEQEMFEYINLFYNRKRLHSTLGYLSPVEYRRRREGGFQA